MRISERKERYPSMIVRVDDLDGEVDFCQKSEEVKKGKWRLANYPNSDHPEIPKVCQDSYQEMIEDLSRNCDFGGALVDGGKDYEALLGERCQ